MIYAEVLEEFCTLRNEEQATILRGFFKTGKGQYGEGDKFLGVKVPKVRRLVKKYAKIAGFSDLEKLISNEYHEVRLFAILVLVDWFERSKGECEIARDVVDFYLLHTKFINNWDLVDLSVYKILGRWCVIKSDYSILYKLADSDDMWCKRMAVVANWYIVRTGKFDVLIDMVRKFLGNKEDLMHKACGWILREMGKVSEGGLFTLRQFLDENAKVMPRTMLRYAIEKMDKTERQKYMNL